MGSGTGLQPPPDNSFERRADRRNEHTARKSTPKGGFDEAPQRGYVARSAARHQRRARQRAGLRPGRSEQVADRRNAGEPPDARRDFRHLRAAPREARDAPPDAAAGHARRHRQHGGAGQAVARGPAGVRRKRRHRGVDAAPPAAAGEVRRRRRASCIKSDFEPKGDQPTAIAELVEGVSAPRPQPGAARRHRLGQDLHHGEGDRGDAAPGADPRAQQDAGRPALRRVQELLPRQRGRVFRLLLRLLPARSLRPAHRHLHREGIRRSTSRSTACATRRRARCSSATTSSSSPRCRASTASARSRPIRR